MNVLIVVGVVSDVTNTHCDGAYNPPIAKVFPELDLIDTTHSLFLSIYEGKTGKIV